MCDETLNIHSIVLPLFQTESADGASAGDMASGHDMETLANLVNAKFEKKEKQIKRDMRKEFDRLLERDKRYHEEIIATLRRDLSHLTKISHEYDNIKELQRSTQQELNTQHERITSLREENAQLRMEATKVQVMNGIIEALKIENDSIRREKLTLDMRSIKLKSTIAEKEQEILSLKTLIDTQYKRIKLDLTNTRDRFHNEQETIHTGIKEQHLMLTEISEAVKNISSEMVNTGGSKNASIKTTGGKATVPRNKVFVSGTNTSSETTFNKLTGYKPKKPHRNHKDPP